MSRRLAANIAGYLVLAVAVVLVASIHLGGPIGVVVVSGDSMEPGLSDGDLVVVRRHARYGVGDAVAYRIRSGETAAGHVVIHRIVGGSASEGFITQGDNRNTRDLWRPRPGEVLGEMSFSAAGAGRALGLLRAPLPLAMAAAAIAMVMMLSGDRGRPEDEPARAAERNACSVGAKGLEP